MQRKLTFLIILLSLLSPASSIAETRTCPVPANTFATNVAVLNARGETEREYLIDPLEQGLDAIAGNVANLQYADKPARWLVNGVRVAPNWTFRYRLQYYDGNWQPVGMAWIATLPYHDEYFYFVMPVESYEHPKCGYGSATRGALDALLKPRR